MSLYIGDNTLQVNTLDPDRATQKWITHEDRVQNFKNPKLVFDIAGESTEEGARVCAWEWHGGDNQRWQFDYQ